MLYEYKFSNYQYLTIGKTDLLSCNLIWKLVIQLVLINLMVVPLYYSNPRFFNTLDI